MQTKKLMTLRHVWRFEIDYSKMCLGEKKEMTILVFCSLEIIHFDIFLERRFIVVMQSPLETKSSVVVF